MDFESSQFIPADLAAIVNKMIEIRRNTFINAAERRDDDYVQWPVNGEFGRSVYRTYGIYPSIDWSTVNGKNTPL